MNRGIHIGASALIVATAVAFYSPVQPALAQAASNGETIEEIVTTGTRRQGQSPTETLSPIDVISGSDFTDQGNFDVTEAITKLSPALNTQRFPIADGTAFIRPVSLRNLAPDQTLVLVDGSRRHRSPLVNLQLSPLGTVNTGAQAVDFAAIPSAAIERVEVLRDGASAQYGSDAIAGVINVILKSADEGISLSAQHGEYFEGDGERTSLSANLGFGFGNNGFVNATLESSTSDTTSRGIPRADCAPVAAVVGAEATPFNGLCQRWGDPEVDTLKAILKAGFDVSDNVRFTGHVSYSDNETISDFFYRTPVLPPAAGINGRGTLIVDGDGDFLPDAAPQSLVDDILAAGLNPADYITADAGSPSGFVLLNPIAGNFPGGYNPDFGADISDYAVLLGLAGETGGGWLWDIRARIAESEAEYVLGESINPSLGRLSPTNFNPGALTQEERAITAEVVRAIDVGNLASPLNLAFGVEWREETYEVTAGDAESRELGPTFAFFGFGSDGFQGFPIASAGSFDSTVIAGYLDLEADITDRFAAGAAIRAEDYDEFGSTFDFKLSGRYSFTDSFALRGTINTTFRAPTPGQVNTLNVTTTADSAGNLIPFGTYPVNNPIAIALGAVPLDPEDSTNFTLGAIFTPSDSWSLTLDLYRINIEDRLTILQNLIGPAEVAILDAAGIPNAALFDGSTINFFVNGFESEITGADLAIATRFDLPLGNLLVDLRFNYNDQEVKNVTPNTLNTSTVFDFENQVPNERTILTLDYDSGGRFAGFVRINHYGSWGDSGGQLSPPDASEAIDYGSDVLVDIEGTLRVTENLRVAIGAENVFDAFPPSDGHAVAGFLGVDRALTSPYGFNGGFWYLRLAADF